MRLMDHHENSQSNSNAKSDTSGHSSPVPTPSPSSANIRLNSILRITTIFGDVRTGKVVAYDAAAHMVTIHMKGSKPGLTSTAVINLNNCREYIVEQEAKDDTVDPLYAIDISKLKKRQAENEVEKKREASFVNLKASRMGQALFREIKKTMHQLIRWSENDIVINNTVRIVDPYRVENISIDASAQSKNAASNKLSAKSDNDTKIHIMKLVDKFWSDQSKKVSNSDANSVTRSHSNSSNEATMAMTDPSSTV